MKSTLCCSENSLQSNAINADRNAIESCIVTAWLDLVGGDFDTLSGDDWLALCGDIDEGEIYRDWFLWQDSEVSEEWEAYDPITNHRIVAFTKEMLIAKIDRIEAARENSN
ncbi:MAG: hypothetical protein MUE44_18250 [Oscillatoriaceae cyanobacterium Prado104]|jgi:hypothetical protein|nr:hypothetical protein [Oscillatoriaceae cyanobacterium Prado104]